MESSSVSESSPNQGETSAAQRNLPSLQQRLANENVLTKRVKKEHEIPSSNDDQGQSCVEDVSGCDDVERRLSQDEQTHPLMNVQLPLRSTRKKLKRKRKKNDFYQKRLKLEKQQLMVQERTLVCLQELTSAIKHLTRLNQPFYPTSPPFYDMRGYDAFYEMPHKRRRIITSKNRRIYDEDSSSDEYS